MTRVLDALHTAQEEAAFDMELSMERLEALRECQVIDTGRIAVGDLVIPTFLACGMNTEDFSKGGTTMRLYTGFGPSRRTMTEEEGKDLVRRFKGDMDGKFEMFGIDNVIGAKSIVMVDPNQLSYEQTEYVLSEFTHNMARLGLIGHSRYVAAGDIGTNGFSDLRARAYHDEASEDPLWLASITGKSVDLYGLKHRPDATALGVYFNLREEHKRLNPIGAQRPDTVGIAGFGNVGSRTARLVSEDENFDVTRVSDAGGTLLSMKGEPMIVTQEMVDQIGDNPRFKEDFPQFKGNKMAALKAALEASQPGIELKLDESNERILYEAVDWLIPASIADAINGDNVDKIGPRKGIIEAGNSVTTAEAHARLVSPDDRRRLTIVPDIGANALGVICSLIEREANIANITDGTPYPSDDAVYRRLEQNAISVNRGMHRMAELFDQPDLRLGAAALQLTQRALNFGMPVDAEFVRVRKEVVASI